MSIFTSRKDYNLSFKTVLPCIVYKHKTYCSQQGHSEALATAGLNPESFHDGTVECGFLKNGTYYNRKEAGEMLGYNSTKGMNNQTEYAFNTKEKV